MSDFLQSIENDILVRRLVGRGQVLLVAVSGGVDSMVLLDVLTVLSRRHGWGLTVAHFNHGLRGRSSDADERFVRAAARRLELPCISGRGDVRGVGEREGISIEMAARRLRHEFLARSARDCGAKVIALGHHADDQVEWFFVKTLRGGGGAAMGWMNPSPANPGVNLIRPLLGRTRKEIAEYANSCGIKFREDATNASTEILRNKVRHELVPLLEKFYQPALRKVVLREMEITGAEAVLAKELAGAWRQNRRGKFGTLPVAVQRRVLQAELQEQGLPVTFEGVEALRCDAGRSVNVAGKQVKHDGDGTVGVTPLSKPIVAFEKVSEFRMELCEKGGGGDFSGVRWRWSIERLLAGRAPKFGAGVEFFDAEAIGARVVLRRWKPGDRFQPIGMKSAVKLQDLFTNLKVPRGERHRRVVAVTEDGEIWWVEGLRISERFKVRPETRRVLRWNWIRS